MKKPLSKRASQLEASLWHNLKKALRDNLNKVCQK
jgi:hypothetical protein